MSTRRQQAVATTVSDEGGAICSVSVWGASGRSLDDAVSIDLEDVPQLIEELQEILAKATRSNRP